MKRKIIAIVGISIFATACGSSSSSSNSNSVNSTLQVLASNVVFSTAQASENKALDTSTQVLARNVVIDATTNRLTSENLQDALDNEMQVDLAKLLPGTTWNIENKTTNSDLSASGQIVFSDSTFSVSGDFGAAGLIENYDCCYPNDAGSVTYELINSSIIYITHTPVSASGPIEAVVSVLVATPTRLVTIGRPTCYTGPNGISILTLVE